MRRLAFLYVLLMVFSACLDRATAKEPATSDDVPTALQEYVAAEDDAFAWKIRGTDHREGCLIYDIDLTSQEWQGIKWNHVVSAFVPDDVRHTDTVLLFIMGGRNGNRPRVEDLAMGAKLAILAEMPVAFLYQVPNQPLLGDRIEDDLISETFLRYLATKDANWPLLFPMVKSAVRAMDAIQQIAQQEHGAAINQFVVTGGSKRGWTTWLAGAVDPRVAAIAPMVIDTLNFEKQMPYQLEVWGAYSDQIEDYTKLNLQERMNTPEGKVLNQIVDPYSYLDALTMPKMIFIGTNDPYWPVDAIKHYLDDLKGDNSIHYVPNAGHGLGDGEQAVKTLGSFFAEQASGGEHPPLSWKLVEEDGKAALEGKGDQSALDVVVWTACSGSRDFRKAKWEKSEVEDKDIGWCSIPLVLPEEGYKAFYAEVYYYSPLGGTYSKCSRVFVADKNKIL